MQIPNTLPQFLDTTALMVVVAKEEGVFYRLSDGKMERIAEVDNHPPSYSDREGFFFRSGYGIGYSSGAPLETDKQENIRTFMKAAAAKLNELISKEEPQLLYVFEPAHLRGRLMREVGRSIESTTSVHTVKLGNYVREHPKTLLRYVQDYIEAAKVHEPTYATSH